MKSNNRKEINYALVEEKRPPIYTSMKYWGKKPHNIWKEYITVYTKNKGVYLDPFSGSAMSAFESYRAGKKAIALDINPLTSFVIEAICSEIDEVEYIKYAKQIITNIKNDEIYKKLYLYKNGHVVHNVKWDCGKIYEVCVQSIEGNERHCLTPNKEDNIATQIELDEENLKYPKDSFRKSDSFSKGFLENIGKTYDCLYTKRNLYVLSRIFSEILSISNETIKHQLLFAFIQSVHLSTKMCVPRSKKTNRDFSTSWGRSAFLYSKRQMEMNPLLLFENSCYKKQSVLNCLKYVKKYFKKIPKIADIREESFDLSKDVDIWYGVVDIKQITKYIPKQSIDFILTDPPYGGLIQYLDLSSVWLSWLELYDEKYKPNYDEEITVNGIEKDYNYFEEKFTIALKNLNFVLKDEAKLILTFNNKDIKTWSTFLKSIENAGFKIEKVIHQQNKRTSESNVGDPYGMSASDYYIRCVKTSDKYLQTFSKEEVEKLLLDKAIEIIKDRNEPTPYQILFNGLLVKMSTLNVDICSFDEDLYKFMNRHINKEFIIYKNAINSAGSYWWINGLKYNESSNSTLTNRVKKYISEILEKYNSISEEKILEKIFKKFPNELTPDMELIKGVLKEYAVKKNEIWEKK